MKEYEAYKKWWIETQAQYHVGSLYWGDTPEDCFKTHINKLSLYELFETLSVWSNTE